jgi:hypothetical protein
MTRSKLRKNILDNILLYYMFEPINQEVVDKLSHDLGDYLYTLNLFNDELNDFRPIIPNVNLIVYAEDDRVSIIIKHPDFKKLKITI